MRTTVRVAAVVLVALGTSRALATDQPVHGKRLAMTRTGDQASLVFLSKDPGFLFPARGGADDPASGAPGGLVIELFSPTEGMATLAVPRGRGKPGWTQATRRLYRYANADAPDGPSPVKVVVMKSKRMLKVVAAEVPLPLALPQSSVGVRITSGSMRTCARFDPATIVTNVAGSFEAKESARGVLADCSDASLFAASRTTTVPGETTTTTVPQGACIHKQTFETIQNLVFNDAGCNVSTCHGAFAAASLDLRPGASYAELVNVTASNPAAAAAGKKLVLPGDAAKSFLSQKLHGTLGPDEGAAMPLVGHPLPADQLGAIDAWIQAGAPESGSAPGVACLAQPAYTPAPALAPPPGGYQLVLDGPTLQPGEEQEGCMWVPAPNASDFYVSKWEFSLNPGTHHFAVFEWSGYGTPTTGVWTKNDFGCFSGAQFGNNVSGAAYAPYFVDAYPDGVARLVRAGHYLGLNAHYHNGYDVPIQIKVWINMYPYVGTPPHVAQTIIDIDDTFAIDIPPFTVQVFPPPGQARARWTNTDAVPRNVIFLGGHMHYRGLRFTVWGSDATKLYESYDWSHPNTRFFSPPLVIPPGGFLDYECEYDNGINRPVRTDATGRPTDLVFGTSTEDAMCIVTGTYFE
jgi:hypothetical protein